MWCLLATMGLTSITWLNRGHQLSYSECLRWRSLDENASDISRRHQDSAAKWNQVLALGLVLQCLRTYWRSYCREGGLKIRSELEISLRISHIISNAWIVSSDIQTLRKLQVHFLTVIPFKCMHQCLFWTHIKMFPCGYKHQSLIRYFFMLMKIFWYHHFLPFITECTTASISWYRYNRISAYSADHGGIQTTPWRTQVRLNSLYSNDKRLVSKLITLY